MTVMLALIAAALGAAASTMAGRLPVLREARNAIPYLSFHYGLMFLVVLPFAPWALSIPHMDAGTWGLLALVLSLDVVSNVLATSSFSSEPAYRVSTLFASAPLFALLLTPFVPLAAASTTASSVAGVVLVVAGVAVASGSAAGSASAFFLGFGRSGVWKTVLAAAMFGSSVLLTKPLLSGGAMDPYSFFLLRCGLLSFALLAVARPRLSVMAGSGRLGLFRAAAAAGQWMFLLYAVRAGSPAVANAVNATVPLFVLAAAWPMLGRRPSGPDAVGGLLVVAGVASLVLL